MTDLVEWLETAISEREAATWAACGRNGAEVSEPERWQWVETEDDRVVDLAAAAEYLNKGCNVSLRSVQEYPTNAVGPLPHFVIHDAQELEATVGRFLALNDPHTELRRCAADRKILELWHAARESAELHADAFSVMREAVQALAEGYGYQEVADRG